MPPPSADIGPNATSPLSILNHPASRLPGPSLLHELIQSYSNDGISPAIDYLAADGTRTTFSYANLHASSDALASRISTILVLNTSQFIVPVLIPQSPALYISQLAILKAGGAFCPLNLDIPVERAKLILYEVNARIVITTKSLASRMPIDEQRTFIFVEDEIPTETATTTAPVQHRHPLPTDLAYIMYTSGSTGVPKGVPISHSAATQSLLAHERHIPPFSRFLQFAAPTFDVSVFEIFFPLFRGQTLVSCDRNTMLNDLPGVLGRLGVDACELTPSVAGSLLRTRGAVPGLRLLLTIGEMLTEPVVREFGGGDGTGREGILWGMYGPTEAAIHCTVKGGFGKEGSVGDIGVPFDTVSAFILAVPEDDQPGKGEFRVLPRGEVGELALGGCQNAEGYINRPEQTAAAFIDTPYGRLYRTGDKAAIHPDGRLECLGRIGSGQVKLRGQRIELGEIEHAALRVEACHGAVAAVVKNVLVLFCAVDEVEGMLDKVKESCGRWLPGFMVPGDVVVMREFPRLTSGKVDRKGLVGGYEALEREERVEYVDEVEKKVCEVVGRVLGVEVRPGSVLGRVGVDSLMAIKLASALQEAGLEVGGVDILTSRTVAILRRKVLERRDLAATQGKEDGHGSGGSGLVLDVEQLGLDLEKIGDVEAVIPCTPLQTSMLAETMANSQAYCNWIELEVPAEFEAETVRSWFLQLAKANEVLRTGFVHHQGRFLQVIFRELDESKITLVDIPTREFTLSQDSDLLLPSRTQITNTTQTDHRNVVLQLHHALYDGWSIDALLSDLHLLSNGAPLPSRPQFRRLVAYYYSPSFLSTHNIARPFWASQLASFSPPPFPSLQSSPPSTATVTQTSLTFPIPPSLLKSSLSEHNISPQDLFLAALTYLWSLTVGVEDVLLGTVSSGRTLPIPGIESIIGPCISILPIRTNLSRMRTVKDLLASIHGNTRAGVLHSGLPLGEIKRVAGVRPGEKLYDVLFVWQEGFGREVEGGERIRPVGGRDYLETRLLVEVEPREEEGGVKCSMTGWDDVFGEGMLNVLGRGIEVLVGWMYGNLGEELGELRGAFPREVLAVGSEVPKTVIMFEGSKEIVPFGAVGEVCFEIGEKVAQGYLRSEELKEKVIQHPTFGCLYRSGDRGRMHPDGSIILDGRLDNGFEPRGRRAELDEITATAPVTPSEDEDYDDLEECTLAERQLATIISEAFRVEKSKIQRWTPLTTFGLDSLSAIDLTKRINVAFGKRVGVSEVLRGGNVVRLAAALAEPQSLEVKKEEGKEDEGLLPDELVTAISKTLMDRGRTVADVLPCTPLQEAMLAVSTGTGRGRYLNRMLLKVSGDVDKLKEAWMGVCQRHGILRTCFVSTEDLQHPIIQVVLKGWQPPWLEMDACGREVEACVRVQVQTVPGAIDELEPTVSFAVIKDGDGEGRWLSFVCHHALYDGVAIERLLWEVEESVGGRVLEAPPAYADFLREALRLPEEADVFWGRQIEGFQPRLLEEFEMGEAEAEGFSVSRVVATPLSNIVEQLKGIGVSLLTLSETTWAAVLSCLLRTTDICFGGVFSGRSLALKGIDRLVAPCFNTIPVRVDLSDKRQIIEVMKEFQGMSLGLLEHQFTPLRHIQSLAQKRAGGRLFDTLLLLQQPSRRLDENIWRLERDEGEMDIPLVCELLPNTVDDTFTIKLHVEGNRIPLALAHCILNLSTHILDTALRFPASSIPTLATLPADLRTAFSTLTLKQTAHSSTFNDLANTIETWTPSESVILAVISSLTSANPTKIRRQTTIYQLGLDSISAVQIASLLRKQGFDVSAGDVIEHPTCERLALHLDNRIQKGTQPAGNRPSDWSDNTTGPSFDLAKFQKNVATQMECADAAVMPCTPLQAGMMAQFIKSGGRDYFNFMEFRVESGISRAKLVEAWEEVRDVHPILRLGIHAVDVEDVPFAMVCLWRRELEPIVEVVGGEGEGWDVNAWRRRAARGALEDPGKGLWRVVVLEREGVSEMHLAIHHALYDAHSLRMLLGDLAGVVRGDAIPRPVSILNAAVNILDQISTGRDEAEVFWRGKADRVVINSFPIMTPLRETTRRILVHSAESSISLNTLETSIAQSGYTMQAVLQAAWARILSSYLGEASVTFGVVLSGRTTDATQEALFPCITTLPVLATSVASNRALLEEMMAFSAMLHKQQHQPLVRIQQWLGRPGAGLFDTLLVYQKFNIDSKETEAEPWSLIADDATVDYPVSIEVEPSGDGMLKYQVTYFSDILSTEQAQLLLQQFDAVVQHLASHPDGEEGELARLCPEVFSVLPAEEPVLPAPVGTLHGFVEGMARSVPGKTALLFVDGFEERIAVEREWNYAELDANGNRVANALREQHVKVGDVVAIDFDKCPEAYFAILGVLKAGASFVALDPGAPRARKEFILGDSGAKVLVTGREEVGYEAYVPVVRVDEEMLKTWSAEEPELEREVEGSDVAYCLYTSGTTGTPKGCEITHDNAVQCMMAFQAIFEGHWEDTSRWLQFASLHFDVSVLEQYWSWSVGITLVGAPRDLILEDLAGTISRLEITHIDLTPSLARLLNPDEVPSLCRGVFITGGESLKQEILDVWGEKGVIYNFYGPTEATIGVTVFPRVPENGRASNIGRQFLNVGAYVLNPGTDVPVIRGAVGELCVSGRLVGKGYLKREELTRERFPTLEAFGERVYRTGDLVRVLHDGCFDFLGRADDQVKLRGQRLEIGEINHAVKMGVGEVEEVVTVVVRNKKKGKDFLVSFVVVEQGRRGKTELEVACSAQAAELARRVRQACRERLPGYMVPSYVFQLPFIPLSRNNKAEVKELKALFNKLSPQELVEASSTGGNLPAQLSETGEKITAVLAAWNSVGANKITPASSIFELGVDSISVLRLSRELKNVGLSGASPAVILRHPVIDDLARVLEAPTTTSRTAAVASARQVVQACAHRHRAQVCEELGVKPDQIEYIAPCSPLQQGMISRSSRDGAYFNTFRFCLKAGVSTDGLRGAWESVVRSTPILRTLFVITADGCVQVALKEVDLPWDEVPLKDGERDDVLEKRRQEWVGQTEDAVLRPWEILLVVGDSETFLVLYIFHGLYDANSLRLLIERVASEYSASDGSANGTSREKSAPSFLEALCHGPLQDLSYSEEFWVKHLQNVAPTRSKLRAQQQTTTCSRLVSFVALEELRSILSVTHQAIVQAAWILALARKQHADPIIGMIVSGRTIEFDGADKVIGPLFNTLPYHCRIFTEDRYLSWATLIKRCHDFNTAVLEFQHVPLRDIQKWCSGGKPLFDTLFSFQREDEAGVGSELWTQIPSEMIADYPLAFEATLTSRNELKLLLVGQGMELKGLMDDLEMALRAMASDSAGLIWPDGAQLNGVMDYRLEHPENGIATPAAEQNVHHFAWTEEASAIKREIAALGEVSSDAISETTSIFELGLDSIDVIKLAARLKPHGIRLKTSQIMRAQSISKLVQLLDSQAPNGHPSPNGNMQTVELSLRAHLEKRGDDLTDVEAVLPTTPLQDSMVAEMVHSDFQLYFNHDILELEPDVDIEILKTAWQTVIMGSPILRTAFIPLDSPTFDHAYCQLVESEPHYYLAEIHLEDASDLAKITDAAVHRARKSNGQSNLLQLVFAEVNSKRYLVLSIAHALYDGWSLDLLHQDVRAAYRDQYSPRPPYDSYLHETLHSTSEKSSHFWSTFLDGVSPTLIPETSTSQEGRVFRAETSSTLPPAEISSFCKSQAITLQALGQACWAAVLANRTGSLDVIFGTVLSGRDSEFAERLMFPTMNTVVMRNVLHGKVSEWLTYVQGNVGRVVEFGVVPLRKVVKGKGGGRGALFNSLFVVQRRKRESGEGRVLMRSVEGTASVEFPVCVEMEMQEEGVVWRGTCDGGYLSEEETKALLKDLDRVLVFVIKSPEAEVVSFDLGEGKVCGLPAPAPKRAKIGGNNGTTGSDAQVASVSTKSTELSPLEGTIRKVLGEVSGLPLGSVHPTHNIYNLGMDSISAIKAVSLLRKQGVVIAFRDLLRAKTISELALLLSAQDTDVDDNKEEKRENAANGLQDADKLVSDILESVNAVGALDRVGIDMDSVEEVLPATAMQVHMLSVWENTQGRVFYPKFSFRVSGTTDKTSIMSAWQALVAETPVLRTTFVTIRSADVPFLQIIHREQPEKPYTAINFRQDNQGNLILELHIHHALYDAFSLSAILRRLSTLCSSQPNISPSNPLHTSLSPWKSHISSTLALTNHNVRKNFWTNYLSGVQSPPLWRASSPRDPHSRISFLASPALNDISTLRTLCTSHSLSIQSLFFAAYATYLSSTKITNDVIFGIYLANRAETNIPTYPTLCLVPLRVKVEEGDGLISTAERVQQDLLAISSGQNAGVGLWEFEEWTGVKVETFVNFMSYTGELGGVERGGWEGGEGDVIGVRFEEISSEAGVEAGVRGAPEENRDGSGSGRFVIPRNIEGNVVRDAYLDAVDVEVAIKGEEMIIGVFGPKSTLGEDGAKEIVERVVLAFETASAGIGC